jgi:hypothetical protein
MLVLQEPSEIAVVVARVRWTVRTPPRLPRPSRNPSNAEPKNLVSRPDVASRPSPIGQCPCGCCSRPRLERSGGWGAAPRAASRRSRFRQGNRGARERCCSWPRLVSYLHTSTAKRSSRKVRRMYCVEKHSKETDEESNGRQPQPWGAMADLRRCCLVAAASTDPGIAAPDHAGPRAEVCTTFPA